MMALSDILICSAMVFWIIIVVVVVFWPYKVDNIILKVCHGIKSILKWFIKI